MRKPLVVANWKMNGSLDKNEAWFNTMLSKDKLSNVDIVVAPSYVYLAQSSDSLGDSDIFLGVQDIASHASGAFTGQVSVDMIKDFTVDYVIVGHSERRTICLESDELVANKAKQVLSSRLCAIACVGETLDERRSGETKNVIARQLNAILELCKNEDLDNLVIAYEPVWAIGTGQVATPEQAEEIHVFIREQIERCISKGVADSIRILYGGSVKPENAEQLFSKPNIDGGLIGGASNDANSFMQICIAAER